MSKIQDALRKLQNGKSLRQQGDTSAGLGKVKRIPESVIPITQKRLLPQDAVRHHVEEESLIRGGLLAPLDHAIPISDEFRRIKRPLLENAVNGDEVGIECANVIMVASALPGAGKTFCSVNLAASISLERELNVLLIDADVAKPHISEAFGLGENLGLIDLLEKESAQLEEVLVRTDLNDIQILPAGRKHAQSTELLASVRMEKIVADLATRYPDRIIVMDSPPLLITSEAQALAKQAGQIAIVVETGKTTSQQLQEVLELLDRDKPINAILNKSVYTHQGGYYGGGYGYYGFNEEA